MTERRTAETTAQEEEARWRPSIDLSRAAAGTPFAAYTKRAAAVAQVVEKAKEEGEGEEEKASALEALEAAPSGRRPALEALAYLALCGMLAAGALATHAALIAPHLEALTPYKPLIPAAGRLGGGFNPSSQHLMISEVWDSSSSAGSRSGDTVKVEA